MLIGEAIVPTDIRGWMIWHGANFHKLQIAYTFDENFEVSTIFLGLDSNMRALIEGDDEAPALVFETMAFEIKNNERCDTICSFKSATREQALLIHEEVVKELRKENENTI
jgi:hypothetical protein